MQTFSQYLQAFGILIFTLMCTPQNIFAISLQSPKLPLTSKEHKKKFALRGTRGKPGHQGSSGGSTGPTGPTGPTGQAGVDTGGLAGLNGCAIRGGLNQTFPIGATIVPFTNTELTEGVSYNGTTTFTINTAGQYRIFYMLNLNGTGFTTVDSIQTIIQINGVSQLATNVSIIPNPPGSTVSTMYEGIFALNVNDQINVLLTTTRQVITNTTHGATFVISKLN